jgi:hypothetical protein
MAFKSINTINAINAINAMQNQQDSDASDALDASKEDSQKQLDAYYQQLSPFERQTCDIAREHLGSSFDLARSNGFLRWLKRD